MYVYVYTGSNFIYFIDAYAHQTSQRPGVKLAKSGRRKNSRGSDAVVKPSKKSKLLSSMEPHMNKKIAKPKTLVVSIERIAVSKLSTSLPQKDVTIAQLPVKFPRSKLKGKFAAKSLASNGSNESSFLNSMPMDTTISS